MPEHAREKIVGHEGSRILESKMATTDTILARNVKDQKIQFHKFPVPVEIFGPNFSRATQATTFHECQTQSLLAHPPKPWMNVDCKWCLLTFGSFHTICAPHSLMQPTHPALAESAKHQRSMSANMFSFCSSPQ